jgi:YYY domain-containing protein
MEWFTTLLTWYFFLFVIGLVFLPITKKIFGSFYDLGYPFAKTIAIIVVSYTMFILGILKLIPFSQESLFFIIVFFGIFLYRKFSIQNTVHWIKHNKPSFFIIVFTEIVFFFSLLALAFIRGQEPSIHGLEKFMDFGFMQSILRSQYFPPIDMWLSADPTHPTGYPINYYYFGHLSGAMLIKLTGISAFVGYNLILATIFAQGMVLAFSLTSNLVYFFQRYILKHKTITYLSLLFYGFLGSILVNLSGNLQTIYLFTEGYPNEQPVPFWKIFLSWQSIQTTITNNKVDLMNALIQNSKYWYPNATRFIPFTIHEFPSYSYVVADLHGHVFDIPFVLLTLGVLIALFTYHFVITAEKHTQKIHHKAKKTHHPFKEMIQKQLPILVPYINYVKTTPTAIFFTILIGFMTAIHYMTNAFDGPIYLLLTILLFIVLYQFSLTFLLHIILLGTSFYVFSKPFSFFFSPFVSGVGVNCSPGFLQNIQQLGPFMFEKDKCQVTELWMLPVLWGFFWISALLFFVVLLWKYPSKFKTIETANGTGGTREGSPLARNEREHLWGGHRVTGSGNIALREYYQYISQIDLFILFLFAFGTFLIIIPEFFYIKDIYPAHFRANTMFKMGYQAFMMMSIASAYVFYRISQWNNKIKYVLKTIYICFFSLVFIYPFLAFPSYYPGLYNNDTYKKSPQLDGAKWLETSHPQDKEIIDYINTYIKGQPVILEAQGDSYTDHDRISAYTGLPTVSGWWVHEWLWRGNSDVVGKRIPDIVNMYESHDVELTKLLLKKYNVSYVVISKLEREKYPNLYEEKFNEIGVKIFESNNKSGALYQIK